MEAINLEHELISKIVGYLPNSIQFQLLKSKKYAEIAYYHFYKYVKICRYTDEQYMSQSVIKYIDEPIPLLNIEHQKFNVRQFGTASSLLIFYRNNPLYVPHTLIIEELEPLKALFYHKPNFVKKFKKISFVGINEDYELDPIFQLKFEQYGTMDVNNIPNYVESLMLVQCYTNDLPKSINILNISGINFNPDDLKNLPSLQHLIIQDHDELLKLDLPNLKSLTLVQVLADLSGLLNLDLLYVDVEEMLVSIGYNNTCDYELPGSLSTLTILNLNVSCELTDFSTLELTSLVVNCEPYFDDDIRITSRLPPNLETLFISKCSVDELVFPDKLKTLKMSSVKGFSLSRVPLGIQILDLMQVIVSNPDFSKFLNLSQLTYDDKFDKSFILPSNLKDFTLINDNNDFQAVFRNLQTPNLVTRMSLDSIEASSFENSQNLLYLKAVNLKNLNPDLAFNFQNLSCLFLSVKYPRKLPNLPDSLQLLQLQTSEILNKLKCPTGLKILKLDECKMREPEINNKLEVLWLNYVDMDITKILEKRSTSLEYLYLKNSKLKKLKLDLTTSPLIHFSLEDCTFKATYVKFPKTLQCFRMYDINDDNSKSKIFDWLDVTLCKNISQFHCPRTGFQKKKNADKFSKLINTVMQSMSKLEI